MISAVVPAFNEERNLAAGVRQLLEALEAASPGAFEVVVVDDGSTDRTPELIAKLAAGPRVRGIRLPRNRGKGAALRAGVAETRGELVLVCDADMATPPALLPRFVAEVAGGADVVIGSRRQPASEILRGQSGLRTFLGRVHTRLAVQLLGVPVSDFTCGFKLFRGEVARWLFARCRSNRWGYDAEILVIAHRAGLQIREVAVSWRDGLESRVVVLPAMLTTLLELVRIRLRYPPGRRVAPPPDVGV